AMPSRPRPDRAALGAARLALLFRVDEDPPMLKLYYHPLASFCWKVLIALYENDTPFEPLLVDLADETSAAAFRKVWPIAKFPVLRDDATDRTIPESTIIIEYLQERHARKVALIPAD